MRTLLNPKDINNYKKPGESQVKFIDNSISNVQGNLINF